ncbi:MAG: hypothetical protein RIB60_03175 [Phycisphaerales bacterium]
MTDTPTSPPREEILSTIVGDRACATCGFNLYGQHVVREPHYGLIAARCPECGTLAALQEYPALGTWARRWAIVLSALWVVIMLGVFAATTMTAFGLTIGSVEAASDNADHLLAADYTEWVGSLTDEQRAGIQQSVYTFQGSNQTMNFSTWDVPNDAWPGKDDPRAVLDEHGGAWRTMERAVYWLWILMVFLMCPFATFWSLAMLHQRAIVAAIVPVVAVGVATVLFFTFANTASTPPYNFDGMARNVYITVAGPVSIAVMAGSAVIWALIARPAARFVVRLALPPRLRVPFGVLWWSAGKPLPRAR